MKSRKIAIITGVALSAAVAGGIAVAVEDAQRPHLLEVGWNRSWQNPGLSEQEIDGLKTTTEGVIEGSIAFRVDQPIARLYKHLEDPGTLGKVLPFVKSYEPVKVSEDDSTVRYKVAITLDPYQNGKIQAFKADETKIHIDLSISKNAMREEAIVVKWGLDPDKENDWDSLSSRVYAVDLHNGGSMVLVTSSSKPRFNSPTRLRLEVAKLILTKIKRNIVAWADSLPGSQPR